MGKYLALFEGRIKRQRQSIGLSQRNIMTGRDVKANRELIAKAEAKIASLQKLIDVNSKKES